MQSGGADTYVEVLKVGGGSLQQLRGTVVVGAGGGQQGLGILQPEGFLRQHSADGLGQISGCLQGLMEVLQDLL